MTGPRLLATRQLPYAGLLAGGCAAITIVLGEHFSGSWRAGRLDRAVDRRLRYHLADHSHLVNTLITAVPFAVVVLCAVLLAVFVASRRARLAVLSVAGPLLTVALVDVALKPWFDRRLEGNLSFPSGHTAATASVAAVIAVALLGPGRPKVRLAWRLLLVAGVVAATAVVAAAMVAAGDHYATDTIGGFCVGTGTVLALSVALDVVAGDGRTRTAAAGRSLLDVAESRR